MPGRRTILAVTLATAAAVGCRGNQVRRDPLRRQAVPTSAVRPLTSTQQPFASPVPPAPPPLPQPAGPSRPAVYAQTTPQRSAPNGTPPGFGEPATLPDAPLSQTQGTLADPSPPPAVAEANAPDAGPIRDRIHDRREARNDLGIGTQAPPPAAAPAAPPPAAPTAQSVATQPPAVDRVHQLIEASKQRYAGVNDFEARLVKREVVNGKQLPQDEVLYKFRKQPLSVYVKVLSEAGQGREVIFVKGRDDGAMHVVTGKGDNRLVGAGFKTTVDPDGRDAASKSRYRIYEAGFGRTYRGLEYALQRGFSVKAVGLVQRPEYPYPLECIEITATTAGDPSLPAGAKRNIYLDPKADSPSYLMPVLSEMHDASGRQIEHYCFDQFKLPAGLTDDDFDPSRLGKRR